MVMYYVRKILSYKNIILSDKKLIMYDRMIVGYVLGCDFVCRTDEQHYCQKWLFAVCGPNCDFVPTNR